jgi:hypothetical protein
VELKRQENEKEGKKRGEGIEMGRDRLSKTSKERRNPMPYTVRVTYIFRM